MDVEKTVKHYDSERLGNTLRSLRKSKGHTLEELAKQVGISAKTLARVEKAESGLTVDTLFAIANILNVPADVIIGRMLQGDAVFRRRNEDAWPDEARRELQFARELIQSRYNI